MHACWYVLHLIAGVVIAGLLGIHMVSLHLDAIIGTERAKLVSWTFMMERASQSLWAGIYVALLAFGLYHALYGLRNIILEVVDSAKIGRIVTWSFIAIGTVGFLWGAYVPIALFVR